MRIAMSFAAVLALVSTARAQVVSRVSVDANGNEGNAASGQGRWADERAVAVSSDGNVVAFMSDASNLVPGDSNGKTDIFVFDRIAGTIERVSVDSSGAEADGASGQPALSSDGRIVAFASFATNLVAGDTNHTSDVFLHDRAAGTTERVSVNTAGFQGNELSDSPSLSTDGMLVGFESNATNFYANDTNLGTDIFVRDRSAGTTSLVSRTSSGTPPGPGGCFEPSISADGSRIAFSSRATDLVPGDTNGTYDVFVRDRTAKTTVCASIDSSGVLANSGSRRPKISADGSTVVFESGASNLVTGDDNYQMDVFVHELATGITERVSVDSYGAQSDGLSATASISDDGKFAIFESEATNLVANDSNGTRDVFLHDRVAGTTAILSVEFDGAPSDDTSFNPAVSGDATKVAFASLATNLVANDTNGVCDVFFDDVSALQTPASWSNYGAGYSGTLGIPNLVPSVNPVLGSSITLSFDDSYGNWTVALALFGPQSASIPTTKGGTLLVQPLFTELVAVPPGGGAVTGTIPRDAALFGVSLFVQVLELDPGAAYGMSFTPGLQLTFGR